MLVARGQQELEETLMQWKQKTHLIQCLKPDKNNAYLHNKTESDFMTKFYSGLE
jgi:hypothetical protein